MVPEVETFEVEAGGLRFTALASGPADGRPVLLLHGFPQTSRCFAAEVAALAASGYRAVAPDQRGYSVGARPAETESYRVEYLVEDVAAMATALDMPVFDLVGHDWGGMVAWLVAAALPDRVRTLTSLSTPHPTALADVLTAGDEDQIERSSYIDRLRRVGTAERFLLGEDGSGSGLRAMFGASGLGPELAEPHVVDMCRPGRLTGALQWYRANDLVALGPVGATTMPTLYVWSTGDGALGRRAAEGTVVHAGPQYRFEVLEGVSHWIPDAAPDRLHQLLIGHLDRH
jgi:pimeloyl-ACP methyl ester carboxylesterase